jgi:hypothetical protein
VFSGSVIGFGVGTYVAHSTAVLPEKQLPNLADLLLAMIEIPQRYWQKYLLSWCPSIPK